MSGGADETINIYDMFTRKECGMLMEHNGKFLFTIFLFDNYCIKSCSALLRSPDRTIEKLGVANVPMVMYHDEFILWLTMS